MQENVQLNFRLVRHFFYGGFADECFPTHDTYHRKTLFHGKNLIYIKVWKISSFPQYGGAFDFQNAFTELF